MLFFIEAWLLVASCLIICVCVHCHKVCVFRVFDFLSTICLLLLLAGGLQFCFVLLLLLFCCCIVVVFGSVLLLLSCCIAVGVWFGDTCQCVFVV